MNERLDTSRTKSTTVLPLLVLGNGTLADRLAIRLIADGTSHQIAKEVPEDLTPFAGVVLALDSVHRDTIEGIAAYCLQQNCPYLPTLLMGEVLQIGPLMQTAPTGACVMCADVRMSAMTGRAGLDAAWPMTQPLCDLAVDKIAGALGAWADVVDKYSNRITFHWTNGAETTHPVMRTDACPVCAPYEPHMPFRHPTPISLDPTVTPDQGLILRLEDRLIDALTGPIKSVDPLEMAEDLPKINHVVAQLVDPGWARNGLPVLDCGGNDLDPTSARAAAIGEAIERASASEVWPGHLTKGTWAAHKESAVHPAAFDLYLDADRKTPSFPYTKADENTPLHWLWGTELSTNAPVLVPAAHIFVPFVPPEPEPTMDYPLLSGFAAGASKESAVLSALLEVIERDSFMIAWANQLALQPADLNDNGPLAALRDVFSKVQIEVRVGLLQLDLGAPVAIAMARSTQAHHPAMVLSAASAMTPGLACEKALGELTANWLNVAGTMATTDLPKSAAPEHIRDETAHGLLYARQDMAGQLDFWWDSGAASMLFKDDPRKGVTPGQDCETLVAAMTAAGVYPIAIDLTLPALSDMGLYTVKVVAPGTYPMNFDAAWPQLGGSRMLEAPVRSGLRTARTEQRHLNRQPHPFP